LAMAFVGILGNAIAIVANGGYMVVWQPSLLAAGFNPTETFSPLHTIVPAPLDAMFLARFGFFGDIIPIPVPILQNVASIGDIFLSAGLAFFLFASVVRAPGTGIQATAGAAAATIRPEFPPETGVTPALAATAALERT